MNSYKSNRRNTSGKQSKSSNRRGKLMVPNSSNKRSKSKNQNEESNSNITAIAGNWIGAIGTIISAIGSTPTTIFTDQTLEDLNLIGNILEAGGSAIVSETEDASLDKVGGQISAIGNLAVVAGILSKNEQTSSQLYPRGASAGTGRLCGSQLLREHRGQLQPGLLGRLSRGQFHTQSV